MRRRKHTLKTSEKVSVRLFLCETGGDSETARYGIADMSYRAVFLWHFRDLRSGEENKFRPDSVNFISSVTDFFVIYSPFFHGVHYGAHGFSQFAQGVFHPGGTSG